MENNPNQIETDAQEWNWELLIHDSHPQFPNPNSQFQPQDGLYDDQNNSSFSDGNIIRSDYFSLEVNALDGVNETDKSGSETGSWLDPDQVQFTVDDVIRGNISGTHFSSDSDPPTPPLSDDDLGPRNYQNTLVGETPGGEGGNDQNARVEETLGGKGGNDQNTLVEETPRGEGGNDQNALVEETLGGEGRNDQNALVEETPGREGGNDQIALAEETPGGNGGNDQNAPGSVINGRDENGGLVGSGADSKNGGWWWKEPLELLRYCVLRVRPIWSLSVAAAAIMGFVLLRRVWLVKMKRKSRSKGLSLNVTVDDKKVSQFMSRAARLNEAFSVVKRVPVIRPSLPTPGLAPWPVLSMR